MTADDLKNYSAVERPVLRGSYRGLRIVSMPPPSSGGVVLLEMLNVLEGFRLKAGDPDSVHLLVETMRYAYADRAHLLGDPDFVKAPIAGLMSKRYAASLRAQDRPPARHAVGQDQGRRSGRLRGQQHHALFGGRPLRQRRRQHLHAQPQLWRRPDRRGHRRAAQQRARRFRRRARRAERLRARRLRGQRARAEQAAAVLDDADHRAAHGKPFIVTGSPGGSRIITAVLQVLLNVIDHRMTIAEAVQAPRIHHQWLPDETMVEAGVPADLIEALQARGHNVKVWPPFTSAPSIVVTPRRPDRRRRHADARRARGWAIEAARRSRCTATEKSAPMRPFALA